MNLQQRRRLWYAVHDIPADVRPLFGDKLKFVQSLKTPDKNIAKAKAAALEAEWRTKIDIARGKATVEDDSYWITRAKAATSATEKKAVMSALGAQVFDKEEALYEQHGDSYTETDEYKRLERLQGIASGQIVALDNRLTLHILAAVAEHEREAISARTKAALAAAKARGKTLGGFRGVTVDQAKGAQAASAKAKEWAHGDIGKEIADMKARGWSLWEIAHSLNNLGVKTRRGGEWQATSVKRVLDKLET